MRGQIQKNAMKGNGRYSNIHREVEHEIDRAVLCFRVESNPPFNHYVLKTKTIMY